MVNVVCASCNQVVELPDPPTARIINLEDVSMIVLQHGTYHKCPACGTMLHFAISGCDGIDLVGAPLPGQEKESLLVKPNGTRIIKN